MTYKFIYFDLDDTLLDHQAAERAGLSEVHDHFDLFDETPKEKFFDTYSEVNSEQWRLYSLAKIDRYELQRNRFEQTLEQLGLDSSRYEEVGQFYLSTYRKHWQWIDGAKEAYEKICKHYPVGILTNGFAETQQKKFEDFELNNTARHLVVSEEVGALKPDPRVFEHATKVTGHSASEILYVGNSFPSDVEGGNAYGWNTAWYTQNGEAEKHKQADFVFNDFRNLSNYLNI